MENRLQSKPINRIIEKTVQKKETDMKQYNFRISFIYKGKLFDHNVKSTSLNLANKKAKKYLENLYLGEYTITSVSFVK